METEHPVTSHLRNEKLADVANDELERVLKALKEKRKVLARDWEELTPRERSAYSREVKDLEEKCKRLQDEIEIYTAVS